MSNTKNKDIDLNRGFYVRSSYVQILGLDGVERDVYSIIHSFSENYPEGYTGSRKYLADMLCKSLSTVSRALSLLVERGLLLRRMIRVGNSERPAYFTNFEREEAMISKYRADKKRAEKDTERPRNASVSEKAESAKTEPKSDAPDQPEAPSKVGESMADMIKSMYAYQLTPDEMLEIALRRTYGSEEEDDGAEAGEEQIAIEVGV